MLAAGGFGADASAVAFEFSLALGAVSESSAAGSLAAGGVSGVFVGVLAAGFGGDEAPLSPAAGVAAGEEAGAAAPGEFAVGRAVEEVESGAGCEALPFAG